MPDMILQQSTNTIQNTMNMLQKTMQEIILQQITNTTEHHEYVTGNHEIIL